MTGLLGCNCAGAGTTETFDEELSRHTMSTAHSQTSESSADSEVLNTSYKKVTPLFRNIEKENWEGVLLFLTKGIWSNSILSSSNEHLKSPSAEIQVKTWVTNYDRKGVAEWSQLPLHAAISYMAPFVVIQKLVDLYPKSVQCTDNEGMLPIHLAFGFGAGENVLALLLESFPAAVGEKGLGGRLPHECCELGPNKVRGKVYKIITDETKVQSREKIDKEWREFANAAKATLKLDMETDSKQLTEVMYELMQAAKELQDLKLLQQQQFERSIGQSNAVVSPKKMVRGASGSGLMKKERSRAPGRKFAL